MFYTTLIMNEKDSKSYSYWLRENNKKTLDVIQNKTEDLQTTQHLIKQENKLEVCSFVEKCITKAQKISDGECYEEFNSNQEIFEPSMFNKTKVTIC